MILQNNSNSSNNNNNNIIMLLYCSFKTKPKPQLLTSASIEPLDAKKDNPVTTADSPATKRTAPPAAAPPAAVPQEHPCNCKEHRRRHSESCALATLRQRQTNKRRVVRFDAVHVQEYNVTIATKAYCQGYFPITLDWQHAAPKTMAVNDYEASRRHVRKTGGAYHSYKHDTDASYKGDLYLDVRERFERLRLVSGLTEPQLAYMEHCRQQEAAAALALKKKKQQQKRSLARDWMDGF